MATTWIEVADTAVKIGLGALVTGASAYLLAGRSHAHVLTRDLAAKRIGILESACADAEEYFSYCTRLYNMIGPLALQNDNEVRDQTDLEKEVVLRAHGDLRAALDSRNKARAKISLLGAIDALEHMTNVNETLSKYRKIVAIEGKMITFKQHNDLVKEFKIHKQSFYSAAATFMKAVGTGRGA